MSQDTKGLRPLQRVAYATPQTGVAISGTIMGSWLMFFLVPPDAEISAGKVALVSAAAYGWLELWGKLVDAFADPIVGHWSDRTQSRWGRRMPFIVLGTPLMVLSYSAMWFLPFEAGSNENILYLGAVMSAYWIVFTIVLGPYSALLPEIATTAKERIVLSSTMGIFGAVGMILGGISGEFISRFPEGTTLMGVHIESGIQLVALFGGLSIFLCVVPAINIRESAHSPAKEVQIGVWQGVLDAAKNPAFFPVVGIAFFFKLAGTMVIAVLPYLTTVVLERSPGVAGVVEAGMGEAWQSRLLAIVVIGAVLWMPFIHKVAEKRSNKSMMVIAASIYAFAMLSLPLSQSLPDPTWGVIAVMLLLTFPTSIALIMPPVLFADVIDYDETTSGLRREGIYTGAVSLLTKWSEGLARVIVLSLLAFGSSKEDATGIWLVTPVAGLCMLLGLWLFRRYPEAHMMKAISAFNANKEAPSEKG